MIEHCATKRRTSAARHETWRYALLRYTTLLYAFGLIVHTGDHVHRGIDVLTPEVFWAGNISTLLGMAVIALVLIGHPSAPLAATLLGFTAAPGVAATHLLPHWSAFSDAFPGAHASGVTSVSWAVVLIEIAGLLAMGVAGLSLLRAESNDRIAAAAAA